MPLLAYVRDGVVVGEEAAADVEPVEDGVPDMNPMVCPKGLAWSRQFDAPDRLLHPPRRAGARGEGHWGRITWDEALNDRAPVRIWNDVDEFTVAARVSPAPRPDALTVYNRFEAFMFPGAKGPNEVEPGLVKWLHLAGSYGHLTYTPTEWQPAPADRCVFVGLARAPEQP